ncbi:galactose ABC transporter substrate-binding protein [Clostridium saccharobutylicum]|uniref:D-galactose/methyl-galactoside binding periplasmic protein MglB n=1 Tax=Clostridium saccharobutylicum DSM 13864 TaxID=1345695 RepID=U5MRD5_CLOSA|nr:galactose ABC transporter substrate-binding protein [Clostridium saccharobutylicum]AGX43165.1 D-galactose-binding periplasmic protein MglB [Clostridium saccharobutylicum DSM 13864]AQR90466.1 D-galactose-binding periplasmic protein precursor [Clostridium saccharobutylicum]AQS00372.1 D-galactose-binding periplasmic protein precursor [Clostridium saccharobutylicum]AQS14355.1 D-galactose-binding periplasmic protein precursor [Clostridium saccharobutylicum]MBA2906638.1 methyl-galactoside transpo
MRNLKKILVSIMIPVMMIILITGSYRNNVYAGPKVCRETPIKIAVFLDNADAMYISLLKQNLESIEKENKDKVKFTFFNAKDNQSIQNESIDKALEDNYDLFIINTISPNLKDVEDTFRRIMEKNIPIILNPDPTKEIIDFVKPYKKFVVIGADFEQSGTMEGKILADEWNSNKQVIDRNHDDILQYVILKGRIGSPLTYLRTKYSVLALNQSGIKTEEIDSNNCEWLEDCAKSSIESLFLRYGNKIEAIISNNDAMAVGAVKALKEYGYNKGDKSMTIPVVGIDGMPQAKEFIQKGYMTGTVIVEPHDLAEVLYTIGINLVCNRNPLENTNYKFDDTGYTVHLNYTEYIK